MSYAELKRTTGYSREVYVSFDFSTLSISAKSAKLRLFCQSFDKFGDLTLSVYGLPDYQTNGLTWATQPTFPTAIASASINQAEHANTWLE